ncbi:MAG TPA: nucleotide exchange factor GrpE [Phycisphaerales bacterium]|nr:nucleotide exchange factor GrpE [Phycisphaerales bacterium]
MTDKKTKKKESDEKKNDKPLTEVEKLALKVDMLAKEKDETFEKLQRISADYANYQKRTPKLIADSVAYEKKAIIRSLLPSFDNLALALANAGPATETEAGDNFVKGVQLVYDHMLDALKNHGVEQIEAAGKQFDPTIHEAMMRRTEEDKPDNIVLEEFQVGFKLNGQVIRPSKVIVNMIPSEDDSKTQDCDADDKDSDASGEENQ